MKTWPLYLWLIIGPISLFGQKIYTEHPSHNFENVRVADNAFFSNFIYDLHQDEEGFIWICTLDGLYRFDGYQYHSFKANPNNQYSISGDNPTKIIADKERGFWLAMRTNGVVLNGGGIDYYNPLTETFTNHQFGTPGLNTKINIVNDLLWANNGTDLLLGTQGGLLQYNPVSQQYKIHHLPPSQYAENASTSTSNTGSISDTAKHEVNTNSSSQNKEIYSLTKGNGNEIWVGARDGLYHFEDGHFSALLFSTGPDCKINKILVENKNQLLLGTTCGLFRYAITKSNGPQVNINNAKKISASVATNEHIRTIQRSQQGTIWVGCSSGLFVLDSTKNELLNKSSEIQQNKDYHINRVNTIFEDQSGILWIGKTNGLSKGYPLKDKIQRYRLYNSEFQALRMQRRSNNFNLDGTSLSKNCDIKVIYSMSETYKWVGTSCGLYQFNEANKEFFQDHWLFEQLPDLKLKNITSFQIDSQGNYWVGTNNFPTRSTGKVIHKLYLLNKIQKTIQCFANDSPTAQIPWGAIKSLVEDDAANMWIACSNGLARYNLNEQKISLIKAIPKDTTSLSSNRIRVLFKDAQARIWIGTADGGLNLYQTNTDNFKQFNPKLLSINSLSNSRINNLYQSSNGLIWVGTEVGLNAIDPINLTITRHFSLEHDQKIRGILEKEPGVLCISTNTQLYSYELATGKTSNYSIEDGFFNDRFIPNSCHRTPEGILYFGSIKGLYQINDNILKKEQFAPPFVYTKMVVSGTPIPRLQIHEHFSKGNPFVFKADENTLSFQFASLDYSPPRQKKYRYFLEGLTEKWENIGSKNELTFPNLRPGKYTLTIEGSNVDDIFNTKIKPIQFEILPPWYLSWWAISGYTLLVISLLWIGYQAQLNRRLMAAESFRLQEIDQLKNKLYTNITHELRTPLTVIQGMTKQIKSSEYANEVKLIDRNTTNILSLVNRLLDLAKLEVGEVELNYIQGDIITYLKYLVESFQQIAKNKDISLYQKFVIDYLEMHFDAEKFQEIIVNLLSNALKFTQEGGQIILEVTKIQKKEQTYLQIQCIDTGIGIAETTLPHIFDRFHQAEYKNTNQQKGTGIGLAITQELINLMRGSIYVESELGQGTTFTVQLPIEHQVKKITELKEYTKIKSKKILKIDLQTSLEVANLITPKFAPQILIIEDNTDILLYLISCLQSNYQIVIAQDGKEGLTKAIQYIPDIIISDIKMPFMDGYEFCVHIKANEKTSHIPIILLSAKTTTSAKVKGLNKGADAYLTKPFEAKELQAYLQQLLQQRAHLQLIYGQQLIKTNSVSYNHKEKENVFLEKATAYIEENLTRNITLDEFSKHLTMSRSQVYRKVKALTGHSTTIFIRHIRLKKARQFLQEKNTTIAEISYSVGFKDPAFFSRCFSELFGETPKDFKKKQGPI